jgi:hypothetical protein
MKPLYKRRSERCGIFAFVAPQNSHTPVNSASLDESWS